MLSRSNNKYDIITHLNKYGVINQLLLRLDIKRRKGYFILMKTLASRPSQLGSISFYKNALAIALPVMAQLLIQNLVSLIDNFMVAGLGDVKMSGVNIAGQINFMFMVFVNTIAVGGGIFMAQYNGAKDAAGMQQAFRFKVIVCALAASLYMIVSLVLPNQILSLMVKGNTQSVEIVTQGVSYMRAASFSWIPMAISLAIGSSLREIGRVKPPLVMSIIATVVNTFFNWVFIYGNLGSPRLEVRGAAIATVIARTVEMLLFIIYIRKTIPPFFSRLVDMFKVRVSLFITILRKSGIILISEMIWVFAETVTVALYNTRGGAEIVSGMAASFSIANLFFISFTGIHTATGVIMGSTLGANRLDEARAQKNWMINGAGIFGIFAGILGCLAIFLIPVVFANLSPDARIVTRNMVFVMAFYMPAWCYVNAQFAVSRTGGDTTMGVLVDVTTNSLLTIPGMFIMTMFTPIGPVGMYALIKLVDIVKIIIAALWLRKEVWVKNLTM